MNAANELLLLATSSIQHTMQETRVAQTFEIAPSAMQLHRAGELMQYLDDHPLSLRRIQEELRGVSLLAGCLTDQELTGTEPFSVWETVTMTEALLHGEGAEVIDILYMSRRS